ncbi:hypothetical protein K8T06_14600, partial [bacterium]|nr:hypothetical protein [bacterium]
MKNVTAFFLLFVLMPYVGLAAVIHVPGDQPTIQSGIDAAIDGDIIMIADGIYSGEGNKDLLTSGKAIQIQSENGSASCIIDCEDSGRAFLINQNEGLDTVIQGLTMRNGNVGGYDNGGAVKIVGASPTFINCAFENNKVPLIKGNGGAVGARESNTEFYGCLFKSNMALDSGGACYFRYHCDPIFTDCRFEFNDGGVGGALYFHEFCTPNIQDCEIISNNASTGGGVCFDEDTGGWFRNTTFQSNTATEGGAIHLYRFTNPAMEQCIFSDNFARFGGAIYIRNLSDAVIGGSSGNGNSFELNRAYDGADFYFYEINEIPMNATYNTFSGNHFSDYYISPLSAFDLNNCSSGMVPIIQDVYVSPNGNDENDGLTPITPFQTIHFAL